VRTALFWVITQRIVDFLTDVSGQSIGPNFNGQESSRYEIRFSNLGLRYGGKVSAFPNNRYMYYVTGLCLSSVAINSPPISGVARLFHPIPYLHSTLSLEFIHTFIYRLTEKFFQKCTTHPNPLISQIGNYSLPDLLAQYTKYTHKQSFF
jgi:hypothetical protein